MKLPRKAIAGMAVLLALQALNAVVACILWNLAAVPVLGLKPITYIQTYLLLLLAHCFIKGVGVTIKE